MDPSVLADWLTARLSGPAAERAWPSLVSSLTARVLETPVGTLMQESDFVALVDAWLAPERVEALGPAWMFVATEVLTEARKLDQPLTTWLSEETQSAVVRLVRRPGWVPESWLRQVFKQAATEELLYDLLQRSLRDFSSLVPRMLENLLPAGLGKLARLGTKASTRAFDEVERLLEGEIKKWLERGARRSTEAAAQLTIDRFDAPSGQAAREDLLRFGLERSPAEHVAPIDESAVQDLRAIAGLVARDLARYPKGVDAARDVFLRQYAQYRNEPLSTVLRDFGLDEEALPSQAWAHATWPAVQGLAESPQVRAFIDTLASDLLEHLAAAQA